MWVIGLVTVSKVAPDTWQPCSRYLRSLSPRTEDVFRPSSRPNDQFHEYLARMRAEVQGQGILHPLALEKGDFHLLAQRRVHKVIP